MGSFSGPNIENKSHYVYHICTVSGIFVPNFTGTVEVLVVAGGGGGGMDMGGGGGGGGVLSNASYSVTAGSPITVTVGGGGVGAPAGGPPSNPNYHQFVVSATSGSNSVFGSITAIGGGYGGSSYFGYTPNYGYGANGGSGGGASGYSDGNGGRNGTGTSGQGNNGGASLGQYYSGGGGGAGAVGQQNPPHGGDGILNNILGVNYYWGGGGGGAAYSAGVGGNGGKGGGGGGSSAGLGDTNGMLHGKNAGAGGGGDWVNSPGGDGGQYTGGGGGGGMHYNRNNRGGNGGSGIVIIRHLDTSGTSTFNGRNAEKISSLVFSMDAANIGKGSSVEVLVVAGGGGGGSDMGGGGGGGQAFVTNYSVRINTPINVVVGAGGSGATGYANYPPPGYNGVNTRFGNLTAIGGGGGGSGHYFPPEYGVGHGQDGGNAGGDAPKWGRNKGNGTLSSYGGYEGAASGHYGDGSYTAGGGGGNRQPGSGGRGSWQAGHGGIGLYSDINGTGYYWGGGGGGAGYQNTSGNGGNGGGGGGSGWSTGIAGTGGAGLNAGGNGTLNTSSSGGGVGGTNTGGGGGGGGHQSSGGNGGSGIVIVRYAGSQKATGGTITSSGGYTIHTFTSSETFTPTEWIGAKDLCDYNSSIFLNNINYNNSNEGSFVFNGVNSYLKINKSITTPLTFSSFVKYTDQSVTANTLVNSFPHTVLGISLNRSGGGQLVVYIGNGSNWLGTPSITSSVNMTVNVWYQITFVSDGSSSQLYLNGQNVGSVNHAPSGWGNYLTQGMIVQTGEYLKGNISNTQIYNRAMNETEIKQNFNALRGRFNI